MANLLLNYRGSLLIELNSVNPPKGIVEKKVLCQVEHRDKHQLSIALMFEISLADVSRYQVAK